MLIMFIRTVVSSKAFTIHSPSNSPTKFNKTNPLLKTVYCQNAAAIFFWISSTPRRGDNLGSVSCNR